MVGGREYEREVDNNVWKIDCIEKEIIRIFKHVITNYSTKCVYDNTFGQGDASEKIVNIVKKELSISG